VEFVIVSGMSGAGKSTVISFMEDMGFYCIDNLPASMIPKFAELCMASSGKYERVALVCDIRGGQTFDGLFEALEQLKDMNCEYIILFTEAAPSVIIRRYKETRRSHPLAGAGTSLATAVAFESGVSSPLFAVCGVLAFVVMYDASGVRRETGRQAEIINDIIESFGSGDTQLAGKKLKELIGHSPIEVFAGAVLGVAIGLLMYLL